MTDTMSAFDEYLFLIEMLRDERRRPEWTADDDDVYLDRMMELHEQLSEEDRERVNALGWRTMPEQYDAREKLIATYDELPTDEAIANAATARQRAA